MLTVLLGFSLLSFYGFKSGLRLLKTLVNQEFFYLPENINPGQIKNDPQECADVGSESKKIVYLEFKFIV